MVSKSGTPEKPKEGEEHLKKVLTKHKKDTFGGTLYRKILEIRGLLTKRLDLEFGGVDDKSEFEELRKSVLADMESRNKAMEEEGQKIEPKDKSSKEDLNRNDKLEKKPSEGKEQKK